MALLLQGMVQDMDFCNDDSKLASIGGPDDRRLVSRKISFGGALARIQGQLAAHIVSVLCPALCCNRIWRQPQLLQ